jgi:thiol-disulfide isomerase/thioredoxin
LQQQDILDYCGQWLPIDFMRTDCPHCKALTKVLVGVKAKYGLKVSVLAVVLAPPDTQASVSKYIVENKVTTPCCSDMG